MWEDQHYPMTLINPPSYGIMQVHNNINDYEGVNIPGPVTPEGKQIYIRDCTNKGKS